MKYIIFQRGTVLYMTDKKVPYPFNRYHIKEADQIWKIVKTYVDEKQNEIVFVVTCPKIYKNAPECKQWYGMAGDVSKIIL